MGIEALHLRQLGAALPAGAGGQLGKLLAESLSSAFGLAGCTLGMLVLAAVGASLFFGFSWLHVAERVGTFVERGFRRLIEFKVARDDRRVGEASKAKREETVGARQVELVHEQPVKIEPAVTKVQKSVRAEKEKAVHIIYLAP